MTISPSHPMAIPSRLALWLGVAFFVASFLLYQIMLAIIGCVFIALGVFLWLRYHPHPLTLPLPKFTPSSFVGKRLARFPFLHVLLKQKDAKKSKPSTSPITDDGLKNLEEQGRQALKDLNLAKKKLDGSAS